MSKRLKFILTRPTDDSLEAFENFRKITTLKSTHIKTFLIKDDLENKWEKFWRYLNEIPGKKVCTGNYTN